MRLTHGVLRGTKQREQSLRSETTVVREGFTEEVETYGRTVGFAKVKRRRVGFLQALEIFDKAGAVRSAVLSHQLIGQLVTKEVW